MIGQTIIGATEIKSLVFNSCPEIPLTGDEEAMRVTKIIIEGAAVTKIDVDVVEIALERVVHLIIEQIRVIFFRWRRRRLRLDGRRPGESGGYRSQAQKDAERLDGFHRLRRFVNRLFG